LSIGVGIIFKTQVCLIRYYDPLSMESPREWLIGSGRWGGSPVKRERYRAFKSHRNKLPVKVTLDRIRIVIFRRARLSNDKASWLNAAFAFAATALCVFFLSAHWYSESAGVKSGAMALVAFFAAILYSAGRGIRQPFEIELVVEGDVIRWGRSVKPDEQQRLNVSQIKELIYDRRDGLSVLADVGKFCMVSIGHEVLLGSEDHDAFVEAIKEGFPNLKVEIR
jgi:hypothetical protein